MSNKGDLVAIIEDVPEFRETLKKDIERRYHLEVVTADTGDDGVKIVKENSSHIRLVILDLGMPKQQDDKKDHNVGLMVLEEIKKFAPFLQVIIITGTKKEVEWAVKAMKLGATDYLLKDTFEGDRATWWDKIDEILQQKPPEDEDLSYLLENISEIKEKYKGKWIAVVNREIFSGKTATEAYQKAKEKYPNKNPLLDIIPEREVLRI